MQTLNWYVRRLATMRPAEVAWRARSALRDLADRCMLARRQRPRRAEEFLAGSDDAPPPFSVTDAPLGLCAGDDGDEQARGGLARLIARADLLAAGRFSFFDLRGVDLGHPIRWNRDPATGRGTPMGFSPWIDYRDAAVAGDCKYVWEPSRHHQLVVLGRAYRATGERAYARAVVEQMGSWIDQCPLGQGMQWRSGLELGIRLINWVWAADLIRSSPELTPAFRVRLLDSVDRHVWEIARKYSRGSSSNNHLVGEAAGVYVACSYFRQLRRAARCRREAREILRREIVSQTWPDGVSREQATGYHLFAMQLFAAAGIVGRLAGEPFPPAYLARLGRMADVARELSDAAGGLPMFGDCDDGYVLDLRRDGRDASVWLDATDWLLGPPQRPSQPARRARARRSRCFPHAGWYLLRHGEGREAIELVFKCGPLGLPPLFGHGHADALSFVLRAGGRDILVDPGTYDYFSFPRWREYFRSTAAHNTLTVDGRDQAEQAGAFLWRRPFHARCLLWRPGEDGGTVKGEHDGYARLTEAVIHRRRIDLLGRDGVVDICDELSCKRRHEVRVAFHLAERCRVEGLGGGRFRIVRGPVTAVLAMDEKLTCEVRVGRDDPVEGWTSRGYHSKLPSPAIVGRCMATDPLKLQYRIELAVQTPRPSAARYETVAATPAGAAAGAGRRT